MLAIGAGVGAGVLIIGLLAAILFRFGAAGPAVVSAGGASGERAGASTTGLPADSSAQAGTVSVLVRTDVPGATFSVHDSERGEEVERVTLTGRKTSYAFRLPQGAYEFRAHIAGRTVKRRLGNPWGLPGRPAIALKFHRSTADLKRTCKAATCMVRIPKSGHGSGFLLGDRRTVVTAAHVLSTPDLQDLEIVFDPDTSHEETLKGVRLIHFDTDQDVAVLVLSEAAPEDRPYLLPRRLDRSRDRRHPVFVIGNPGMGDGYDPLYVRDARIVSQRPDELEVDIELKPGYSGGPVCHRDSGAVVGLVSYKIAAAPTREDVGRSFARSIAIADDARAHWFSLDGDERQARADRVEARYARTFGYQRMRMAAAYMLFDGAIYYSICQSVTEAHRAHMADARQELPPTARPRFVRRHQQRAHEEFVNETLPKVAEEVRKRVSSQLKPETDKWYQEAIADETVDEKLKERLEQAHGFYQKLKETAEQLSAGDPGKGLTREEFEESVRSWILDLHRDAKAVIATCDRALEV